MSLTAAIIASIVGAAGSLGSSALKNKEYEKLMAERQANLDANRKAMDLAKTKQLGAGVYANTLNPYNELQYQLKPNQEFYPFGGFMGAMTSDCDPKITGGKGGCGIPLKLAAGKNKGRGMTKGGNIGQSILKEFFEGIGKSIGSELANKATEQSKSMAGGGITDEQLLIGSLGRAASSFIPLMFTPDYNPMDVSNTVNNMNNRSGAMINSAQRRAGIYAIGGADLNGTSLMNNQMTANPLAPTSIVDTIINNQLNPIQVDDAAISSAYLSGALSKANNAMGIFDSYAGGGIAPTSSNTGKVIAGSHESGNDLNIGKGNKDTFVEGGEVIKETSIGNLIFSDIIPVPGSNLTFADVANMLSQSKAEYEKESNTPNSIKNNTNGRNAKKFDNKLNELFMLQEEFKKATGLDKVTVPSNNPEANNNANVAAYGDIENLKRIINPLDTGAVITNPTDLTINPRNINPSIDSRNSNFVKDQAGKVSTWYNRDPLNARNVIGTGLTLADNIYNAFTIGKYTDPDRYAKMSDASITPAQIKARDLKTDYDVDPMLAAIDAELAKFRDTLDTEVSSSSQRLANSRAGMADAMKSKTGVYDTKEKVETELYNQDALNKQQVDQINAQLKTQADQFNARLESGDVNFANQLLANEGAMRSANVANSIDDINNFLTRDIANEMSKRKYGATLQNLDQSGVGITDLQRGDLNMMDANFINDAVGDWISKGSVGYDDFVKGANTYNKSNPKNPIRIMTKEEFENYKKKGIKPNLF